MNVKELLAEDEDVPDILAYLAWKEYGKAQGEMHVALPAEKLQISLGNSHNFEVVDRRTSSQAFMIKVLDQDSPIASYCERVEKGLLKPGIIVFPVMFDIDEGRTE